MQLYLNDLGIINCIACSKEEMAQALLRNSSDTLMRQTSLISRKKSYFGHIKARLPKVPKSLSEYDCRNNQLLLFAYQQIQDVVKRLRQQYGSHRIGIVLSTSTAGIKEGEDAYKHYKETGHYPKDYNYKKQELGQLALFLAKFSNITGPAYTISTACTSSAKTFISAKRLISSNICDAVIVGGCDSFCQFAINGFDALDSLSTGICQPFSKHRDGINIGEGAALFILSKNKSTVAFLGYGESSDGYHITAPDPTGIGASIAIKQALANATLSENNIGYVNLHGTATLKNDEMENMAMQQYFPSAPPCSSIKHLIGHTLGAASAQELAACWLLLQAQYNPQKHLPIQAPTARFTKDDKLGHLNVITDKTSFTQSNFMSNSHAFGGSNVSLIIGQRGNHDQSR